MKFFKVYIVILVLFSNSSFIYSQEEETEQIDCEACCKAGGRSVSSECCRQCNGCDMYDDEAAQECRDFPS